MKDRTGKPAANKGGKAPGGRHKRGRGKLGGKKGNKPRFAVPHSTAPKLRVEAIPRFAPAIDVPSSGGRSAASAVLRTTAGTRGSVGSFMRGQRLLFVGEGNFSLALAVSLGLSTSEGVVATSQDSFHDARSKFPASMQGNIALLQSIGCRPVFGIDPRVMATADAARAHLVKALARKMGDEEAEDESEVKDEPDWPQFDQIVFGFPSAGRSSIVGATATQEMLRAFFTQAGLLLRTQTKAAAAAAASSAAKMTRSQPTVRVAMHKTPYFDSWKCGQIGQDARLRFLGEVPFLPAEYPGYAPESTQHSMKVSIASGGIEGGVSDGSGSMVWYTFTHSKASAKAAIRARTGMPVAPAPPGAAGGEGPSSAETAGEESATKAAESGKRRRPKSAKPAGSSSSAAGEESATKAAESGKRRRPKSAKPAGSSSSAAGRSATAKPVRGAAGAERAKKPRVRAKAAAVVEEPEEDPAVVAALLAARFMRN